MKPVFVSKPPRAVRRAIFLLLAFLCCSIAIARAGDEARAVTPRRVTPKTSSVVRTGALSAPEASQAAAADERFVYAIGSALIARYDRASGQRVAFSSGGAKHLNSGFLWQGKLFCAHSNFPGKPEKSEIMVLNPETMLLTRYKDFGEYRGSLTWAVREGDHWWCTFAHYGADKQPRARR